MKCKRCLEDKRVLAQQLSQRAGEPHEHLLQSNRWERQKNVPERGAEPGSDLSTLVLASPQLPLNHLTTRCQVWPWGGISPLEGTFVPMMGSVPSCTLACAPNYVADSIPGSLMTLSCVPRAPWHQ